MNLAEVANALAVFEKKDSGIVGILQLWGDNRGDYCGCDGHFFPACASRSQVPASLLTTLFHVKRHRI